MCRSIAAIKQRRIAWRTASKRKDALQGDGGRANKETDLPLMGNCDGFGLRGGGAKVHEHDDGSGDRSRRHRVHDDAQLAVIGVGLVGMDVRNLGYGQHRQQSQAKHCHRRHKAGPCAALPETL